MAARNRTVPGVSYWLPTEQLSRIVKLALILRNLHWSQERFTAPIADCPEEASADGLEVLILRNAKTSILK